MSDLVRILEDTYPELSPTEILNTQSANERYKNNVLGFEVELAATVALTQHQQIKQLVELAISHNFIIQPISSGNNWGYGSVAPSDGREIVLLDFCSARSN